MTITHAASPASVSARPMPPSQSVAAPTDDMLDLSALWRAVAARRLWVIVPTLLALLASFLAVHLITPRYTGEARVFLENRDSFYTRPAGDREGGGDRFDAEAVQSQVQIMMSRDLGREVVRRLGLVGNSEFDKGAGVFGAFDKIMTALGLMRHPADRTPEDRVLESFYDRLLVYPVVRSRIVAIEFQSKDAELAARGANMIATVYMEFQEAAKKDTARGASSWLSGAIEELRRKVQEAEGKVEAFRANSGLLMGSNNTTIIQSELADLSQRMSAARAAQAESQARARLIRDAIRSGRTFEIPDVANNDLIRRLIEQRVNLRAQIALEARTLLPEHPRIKELTAQIGDLEQQIRAAAERTVRTLENEAVINGTRVEAIAATMEAQKRAVAGANESEVQLRALEREARTQREQLEQFLARYRDAVSRDSANAAPADARVVSRAVTPLSPSFPKKVPTIAVVTLATLFVSLALVVSRELLLARGASGLVQPVMAEAAPAPVAQPDGARANPPPGAARFRRTVASPPADHGPSLRDDDGLSASADLDAGAAASLHDDAHPASSPVSRDVRVAGLLTHAGRISHVTLDSDDSSGWHDQLFARTSHLAARIVLTCDAGSRPGAVMVLAQELAEDHRTVLLDLASPGRGHRAGLSELLSGDSNFAQIITADPESRLHLVSAGHAGAAAVVAAPGLLALALQALADCYDLVIVDLATRMSEADLADLPAQADAIIVIADHVSNGHAVETAWRLARGHEAPVTLAMFAPAQAPSSSGAPQARIDPALPVASATREPQGV